MSTELHARFMEEVLEDLKNDRLVLPTLPEVALRVREVVDDDDASIADLTRIIASDAALSARLVHVANSPLLRGNRDVQTLEEAATRLGMRLIRDMVTSMVMQQMFQATTEVTDRKLREVWEHSTQVAAIAHALASQFTPLKPEEAMLAGLVHDIGKLPLLTKAEEQPEILEDEDALDQLLWRLHPRIGGVILRAWGFPEALAAVAEQHEKLDREVPEADYVDVVTVANLQAHMGGDHPHADADWDKVPAVHRLGLNPEVSVIEMDETAAEIEEVESLLRS